MPDLDDEWAFHQLVSEEPYAFFRARLRETFSSRGWACIYSDEEADFFVLDRWEVYACPADIDLFHSVVIWEFPTAASRSRWDAGVEEEDENATLHREFSVGAARDLLMKLDPKLEKDAS